jgi:hypothetical protein
MRHYVAAFMLCAAVLLPTSARAEELGVRGNLAISAERLFGVYFGHLSVEVTDRTDVESDLTVVGLGLSSPLATFAFSVPRVGIDYFITHGFTLGGNLGFANLSNDDRSSTAVLFGVRAGYALRLGHVVSIWPRAGFSYLSWSGDDSFTFALSIDAPFTFALAEGFALTAGPNIDLGFLAERGNRDATETLFGVMFGMVGWLNL